MLVSEYPMISDFDADQEAVVRLFHQRYPHAPLPFLGLANIERTGLPGTSYASGGSRFDSQEAWRDIKLCEQRSKFREGERIYIIEGLASAGCRGAAGGELTGFIFTIDCILRHGSH